MDMKLNISKEEAQQITKKRKEEMDTFFKKHCLNNNDPLSIILKTHLYIETCLDQILSLVLPKADKLLKKRFSDKVDIFEALGMDCLSKNETVVKRIRAVNNLRNSFAHDLDKNLTSEDIEPIIQGMDINPRLSNTEKLKSGITHLLGYVHFLKSFEECFPFLFNYIRNDEIFKKDKGNITDDKIRMIYPVDDLLLALKYFKA